MFKTVLRTCCLTGSLACLVAALLAVALWIRSYRAADHAWGTFPVPYEAVSVQGRIKFTKVETGIRPAVQPLWQSFSTDEREFFVLESHVRWYSNDRGFGRIPGRAILFPYWFVVALLGLLAVVLAARWPLKFSLRTFLIATTLVTVALGLLITAMR
jgi:hypothetical protein